MTALEALQAPAVFAGVSLVPFSLSVGILVFWKRHVRNRNRRSPLTSDLLRTPGFGLQDRIDELTHDINGDLLGVVWIPTMFFGIYQMQTQTALLPNPRFSGMLYGATALLFFVVLTFRLVRKSDKRQKYREALAGELAAAQLLEPILAGGGRVLHDVQAPGFNIDHVVVAPGGVFAVDTKHRLKSTHGKAAEQAKVTFDGRALCFPGWTETKPVEQARAQARWLSERLTKSTGLIVVARPVIALPGWYVVRTERNDVIAINPKNCEFMLKPIAGEAILTKESIQRIAYQVEQMCHMPDPKAVQR